MQNFKLLCFDFVKSARLSERQIMEAKLAGDWCGVVLVRRSTWQLVDLDSISLSSPTNDFQVVFTDFLLYAQLWQ